MSSTLKDKGAAVAAIYTTYEPIYKNPAVIPGPYASDYSDTTLQIADKLVPALRDCASPSWFFEAANSVSIEDGD